MELLLIRHAIAEDRFAFARTRRPDSERPLTAEGRRKFKRSLKGLRHAVPHLDVIATSPFTRARQTCAMAAEAYPKAALVALPGLAHHGSLAAVIAWLRLQKRNATVALVDHEPDLGRLAARLTGGDKPPAAFKKGGVGFMEFDGRAAAGHGRFLWILTPALMKRLR